MAEQSAVCLLFPFRIVKISHYSQIWLSVILLMDIYKSVLLIWFALKASTVTARWQAYFFPSLIFSKNLWESYLSLPHTEFRSQGYIRQHSPSPTPSSVFAVWFISDINIQTVLDIQPNTCCGKCTVFLITY